jgi:hypothetical protein
MSRYLVTSSPASNFRSSSGFHLHVAISSSRARRTEMIRTRSSR